MKTTNFRTVEELNLDVNAPAVTPTKVQNAKIVRALKKLSVADPDETLIVRMVSAIVALGINPQAKSSSWLARRLKNHLQAFGLGGAAMPVGVEELAIEQTAAEQKEVEAEPAAVEAAKAKGKKGGKRE
jgi:septal ring-binding cell division protein DamX